MSVVSNMLLLLHLSSFVQSRRKPICMGLYLAPCHIVGIQWLTLWNWLKTGEPETKRVDLSFLICLACLSCDDVMKHRKWLGRFFLFSPPTAPTSESRAGDGRQSVAGPEGAGGAASQELRHRRGTDASDPVSKGRQDTSEGPDLSGPCSISSCEASYLQPSQ